MSPPDLRELFDRLQAEAVRANGAARDRFVEAKCAFEFALSESGYLPPTEAEFREWYRTHKEDAA